MSRFHSYLFSSKEILSLYKGEEPFASFVKKYFAGNKKFGSKDRKQISHLCYCYFRLGKSASSFTVEEGIMLGLFFCSTEPDEILEALRPEWNAKASLNVEEKCSMFKNPRLPGGQGFSIINVFPWKNQLSEGIENKKFNESFFIQPNLFLRLRPGKENIVNQKLQQAGINFNVISGSCLALPGSSKLDEVIELNKEAVVQDYSSQRAGELLQNLKPLLRQAQDSNFKFSVWDCCAGSGGKSIMLRDILGDVQLTVSDVRASILANLKKRFAAAGILNYKSLIADLSKPVQELDNQQFDLIVADVPCTGSGTWGRTPEQLYYFDENLPAGQAGKIEEYAALQKKILKNIIPHLKPGGHLLYITCSVFKKENENQVALLNEKFHLQVVKIETLKGYDKKADSMFAALLKKPR